MAPRRPKPQYLDVPHDVLAKLRAACARLPEAYEEEAWQGVRWRIRTSTFAHVMCVEQPQGPVTFVNISSSGPELDALIGSGHPFHQGWGPGIVLVVLDDRTDWSDVTELLTESYCLAAPKYLIAKLDRPEG